MLRLQYLTSRLRLIAVVENKITLYIVLVKLHPGTAKTLDCIEQDDLDKFETPSELYDRVFLTPYPIQEVKFRIGLWGKLIHRQNEFSQILNGERKASVYKFGHNLKAIIKKNFIYFESGEGKRGIHLHREQWILLRSLLQHLEDDIYEMKRILKFGYPY